MHYQFQPYCILLLLSTVFLILIVIYSMKRRKLVNIKFFIFCLLFEILWTIGSGMEAMGLDLKTKLFWSNAQYIPVALCPVMWLFMVFQFCGYEKWIKARILILLLIIPATVSVLVWFDSSLELVRKNIFLHAQKPFAVLRKDFLPLFWVHYVQCYVLYIFSIILLFQSILANNRIYRRQAGFLLIGLLLVMVTNIHFVLGFSPIPYYDVSPAMFTVSAVIVALGIFRYQLFDLIPLARELIFENGYFGVIVTDTKKRVLDMNETAVKNLKINAKKIIGNDIFEQIPFLFQDSVTRSSELQSDTKKSMPLHWEIEFKKVFDNSYYEINLSPIRDDGNNLTGWLYTIKDTTDIHFANEQLIEKQRELAVSEEQHRVARELHDNIGQILSFSGIQIQTIIRELKKDNTGLGLSYLQRLADVTDDAYKQLRKYVYNLRNQDKEPQSFIELLNEFTGDIRNDEIRIDVMCEDESEPFFNQNNLKEHLLGVIKEAVNNSIKHSGASKITVGTKMVQEGYELFIEDNGCGFSSLAAEVHDSPSSGLKTMKERAVLSGGELEILSEEGKGTRIGIRFNEEKPDDCNYS